MKENALKNHRIMIKDTESGQLLADTKILRFDTLTNSAIISADSVAVRGLHSISAFIFAPDSLYESYGTLRGVVVENEIEVLLGKSQEKEDRKKTRYPVALAGQVNGVGIDEQMIGLRLAIPIETVNMSANGILMKTEMGSFEVGDSFRLLLEMEGRDVELDCNIVRLHSRDEMTEEFGCRITQIRSEQG